MEKFIKVGVITSTHGLHGEVKVYPTTDDPRRFSDLKSVFLDEAHDRRMLNIESVKYFKNMVILKFEDFDRIEDVEGMKQLELYVDREHAVPLEEGEYYIADLIDMEVRLTDGSAFGILRDVMETGANFVYIVDSKEHGEVLIPAIPQCIKSVDIEGGVMTVSLLPGLLDL